MIAKSDTFGFLTDQEALSFMKLMLRELVNIAHRRNFSLASARLASALDTVKELTTAPRAPGSAIRQEPNPPLPIPASFHPSVFAGFGAHANAGRRPPHRMPHLVAAPQLAHQLQPAKVIEKELMPETVAFDFLANRLVDIAAAFARRDIGLATAALRQSERITDRLLAELRQEFLDAGGTVEIQNVLVPAAQMLHEVFTAARKEMAQNPS